MTILAMGSGARPGGAFVPAPEEVEVFATLPLESVLRG